MNKISRITWSFLAVDQFDAGVYLILYGDPHNIYSKTQMMKLKAKHVNDLQNDLPRDLVYCDGECQGGLNIIALENIRKFLTWDHYSAYNTYRICEWVWDSDRLNMPGK